MNGFSSGWCHQTNRNERDDGGALVQVGGVCNRASERSAHQRIHLQGHLYAG